MTQVLGISTSGLRLVHGAFHPLNLLPSPCLFSILVHSLRKARWKSLAWIMFTVRWRHSGPQYRVASLEHSSPTHSRCSPKPESSVIWRIKTGGVQNETLLPSQRRQRHHVASRNKKLNSKSVIARCSTHRQVTSQYQALGFLN